MSYCVNCGVELDTTTNACPLCNTPVFNPARLPDTKAIPPFPKEKGQVESVKRKDLAILTTMVLLSTAVTCGLLNIFVFEGAPWSVLVIGVCLILWVLLFPFMIYTRLPVYVSLLCDGATVTLYLYLITYMTKTNEWFYGLALPIVLFLTVVAELFTLCIRKLPITFLTTALYIFITLGIICGGLEILIDRYLRQAIRLSWSAVVLTVCAILIAMLVTLLSRARLRNAVRRRLHF